jgi:hypothetical protein
VIPEAAWWEFYTPMQERLRNLATNYPGMPMRRPY